jgi:hypothetical protein
MGERLAGEIGRSCRHQELLKKGFVLLGFWGLILYTVWISTSTSAVGLRRYFAASGILIIFIPQ